MVRYVSLITLHVPKDKKNSLVGRFAVDISMNQSNGVQTGDMINRFLDEFPALRSLVLIIKAFLKYRNLNEVYSGGLGSYAIVCLAVSHIQVSRIYSPCFPCAKGLCIHDHCSR